MTNYHPPILVRFLDKITVGHDSGAWKRSTPNNPHHTARRAA